MVCQGLRSTEKGRGQLWDLAVSKVLKEDTQVFCSIYFTDMVTSKGLTWKEKNHTFLNKGDKTGMINKKNIIQSRF